MLDERFSVPDFDLEDDEVPTTICSRCKEEYDIAEIECPSCGLARIGTVEKCKCGNDVYISPKGYIAKKCSFCILADFQSLGVFDSDEAVEQSRAADAPKSAPV